jgi:hypothetical protein
MFNKFNKFKEKLRKLFTVLNKLLVAKQVIQCLQQTKSTGNYANEFQQYSI